MNDNTRDLLNTLLVSAAVTGGVTAVGLGLAALSTRKSRKTINAMRDAALADLERIKQEIYDREFIEIIVENDLK